MKLSQKVMEVEQYFNKFGIGESIKYVLYSKEEKYLEPSNDIYKVLELVSLRKKERSIVNYLNYVDAKKRTIKQSYTYLNDSSNVAKLSPRQIRYMKSNVDKLDKDKSAYLKSFIGVLELDKDGLTLMRVKKKIKKIKALYIANIEFCNVDFLKVLESLELKGIKCSYQDILAFFSLIIELSKDGENVNIPHSYWRSIFGRDNIKATKKVFQDLNILRFKSKSIIGFKSEGYEMKLFDYTKGHIECKSIHITSIKTLVKLNRIKKFKGNFTLNEKIAALELIKKLRLKEISLSNNKINFTMIFLESGKIQMLIDDLKRMMIIMNNKEHFKESLSLGIHLTRYFNNVKKGINNSYRSF